MITPIGDKVAVERLPEEQNAAIVVPEIYRSESQWVKVQAVGNKVTMVKPGDIALVPEKYGHHTRTMVLDFIRLTIISEDDIMAVMAP